MGDVSKIVRQRLHATAKAGAHPDANILTAFSAKSLGEHERLRVLEHLAQCAGCREVVSLAIPELDPTCVLSPSPARAPWLRWPVLRWGALAACVVVVGAAVTLRHPKRESMGTFVAARQEAAVAEKSSAESRISNRESDELAAKVGPRVPQDKPERAIVPRLARRVDQSAPVDAKVATSAPNVAQSANEPSAAQMSQVAGITAPAPQLSKSADAVLKKDGQEDTLRGSTGKARTAEVGGSREMVEVTAAAPEVAEALPGKAKEEKDSPSNTQSVAVTDKFGVVATSPVGTTRSRNRLTLADVAGPAPRWTLSSSGTLERSLDAGQTWETIPVANTTVFRALSAIGSEIWVGGSGGALYHSSDAGQHWVQVKPTADGKSVTADIVRVEFSDARRGKLTTANNETWVTTDAGQSWQKK
jgi:Photosynthesis system II assembly factor YCF48